MYYVCTGALQSVSISKRYFGMFEQQRKVVFSRSFSYGAGRLELTIKDGLLQIFISSSVVLQKAFPPVKVFNTPIQRKLLVDFFSIANFMKK